MPNSWVSALLSAPPLVGIGLISYGVYLWHYPAAVYLRMRLPWYETAPIVLALAFTVASISYFMIERPLQRYRRGLNAHRRDAKTSERMRRRQARPPRHFPESADGNAP